MRKYLGFTYFAVLVLSLSLMTTAAVCASENINTNELVEIESRPGVMQKFILLAPAKPTASVILVGGGPGKYGMYSSFGSTTVKNDGNFLVRTRKNFAEEGMAVAVLDICSELEDTKGGMTLQWRMGDKHAQDIEAVALFMKNKFDLPIWIVGTSSGTFSTINAAINLNQDINGIVLTSAITRRPKAESFKRGILDMNLDQVTLPALIVAHEEDKCFFSPPEAANSINSELSKSPKVAIKYFSGGNKPKTKECKPLSQHGFYGIEVEVVGYIADFIKSE